MSLGNPGFTEWTKPKFSFFQAAETHKATAWQRCKTNNQAKLKVFCVANIDQDLPTLRFAENSIKSARFVEGCCVSLPTVKGKGGGLLPCCGSQLYCHRTAWLLSLFKLEMKWGSSFHVEGSQSRTSAGLREGLNLWPLRWELGLGILAPKPENKRGMGT